MGNVRKHRNIKLLATDKRRNQLALEPNYHTSKYVSENLLAEEMKTIKVKMNKPVYLGMSMLDISKIMMCEFWYDYVQPKYEEKAKLCYMDADSFIIYIKTEHFYKDTANDVEKWFITGNYDVDRPLPKAMNKEKIGFFKDELGGKIMKEFVGLRAKTYAYLMDNDSEHKKPKETKECVMKRILEFNDYEDRLFNNKIILKSQQRLKSYYHDVYTEQINKIALSSNDDKRLQTSDKITTYLYGANAFKVCESEMLSK